VSDVAVSVASVDRCGCYDDLRGREFGGDLVRALDLPDDYLSELVKLGIGGHYTRSRLASA
jgi:hypothetical protein